MLNNFLIFVIALLAITRRGQDRASIAVFSVCVILFAIVGAKIDDAYALLYYLGAAATDLLIIFILSRMAYPTRLTVQLQTACQRFIYLSSFGWVMYLVYVPPELYNFLCTLLYAWTIGVILNGGNRNVLGNNAMDRGSTRVFSSNHTRSFTVQTNKMAGRN